MDLRALIHDPANTIEQIGAALDALSPDERLAAVRTLRGRDQRALYAKAAAAAALTLEDYVPASVSAGVSVRHHGRNTLPVPRTFHLFEKHFCRPAGDSARLFGYNNGTTRTVIGPGYFVVHDTKGNPEWEKRGAIVIDYLMLPDGPLPAAWPKVVPNSRLLQFFVYHQMRDFMRRVSKHVTVGAAYKKDKGIGQYFVLCREE